ncbi:ABC transporter ATP-binding protein [Lactobacillus sp. ESL0791]|uniref:ATP-binding cassette domain-containing protein n=1 Tax=Lactobacillus sp. ESL0791 TaxID=2983234 RepID=UPI0023F8F6EB|nr:ABC transporter ATP-binding protein [Lactobacillus sp. ESL0791]MDF7639637.1 ABC transporter ATP-binding protein [Lactobacillus sp. ESL0791]
MIAKYYSKWKFVLMNVLGLISCAENIVMAYMVGTLTNIASSGKISRLPKFILLVVIFFVIVFLAKIAYNYLKNDAIKQTNSTLRTKVFAGMMRESTADNTSALGFLTNDFKLLETNRFGAEINIIMYACTLVLSMGYALYINWLLTLLFFIGSVIPMAASSFFQKPIQNASTKWTDANDTYVNQTKNFLAGTDSVKLYDREQQAVAKNGGFVKRLERALAKMNLLSDDSQAVVMVVAEVGTFLVPFVVGVYLIAQKQTTIGALFSIVQLSNSFVNPILAILDERNHLSTTKGIVAKVKKYIAKADEKQPAAVTDFQQDVAFTGIDLARNKEKLANGINLEITKGQKTAVVGPSGSGKSTLFQFMMYGKFGQADKIMVDGKEYQAGEITKLFAYASQAPVIFADNLWFNLTLGADIPKERVNEVCGALELGEIVQDKGYDYNLGDNADQLSGGQLARIELARAILSKRPVLLLDEINASLDKVTSDAIHKYLLDSDLTFVEVIHHYEPGELANYDQVVDFKNYPAQ